MRCYYKEHHILDNNIVLSAEISKNGHELIKNNKIPDFIIHEPGSMGTNLVIIEVKAKIDEKGIAKDFNTLSLFLSDCSYELGILILFNCDLKDLNEEDFRKAVYQERAYELAFEGHRRMDLIRWGIYYETIQKTYNDLLNWWTAETEFNYVVYRHTVKGKHELFPIPQRDMDLMIKFNQNPNWE